MVSLSMNHLEILATKYGILQGEEEMDYGEIKYSYKMEILGWNLYE